MRKVDFHLTTQQLFLRVGCAYNQNLIVGIELHFYYLRRIFRQNRQRPDLFNQSVIIRFQTMVIVMRVYLSVGFNNDFRGVPLALCQSCHPFELRPRQNTDAALGLSNLLLSFSTRFQSTSSVSSYICFIIFSGEGHELVQVGDIILPARIVRPLSS